MVEQVSKTPTSKTTSFLCLEGSCYK